MHIQYVACTFCAPFSDPAYLKLGRERESIVEQIVAPLDVVLIVANVAAATLPSDALGACVVLRVHQRTHAVIVERIDLGQIDKVKLVQRARLGVAHAKVKPLRVSPRVDVGLDDHVVLVLQNGGERRAHKCARRKSGEKNQWWCEAPVSNTLRQMNR